MKTNPLMRLASLLLLFVAAPLFAADPVVPAATWHAQSLAQAVLNMLLFVAIGIAAAIVGYKLFDKCTPGDLNKEIVEQKNIAAAIVAGAMILGVCIIVAAAMLG